MFVSRSTYVSCITSGIAVRRSIRWLALTRKPIVSMAQFGFRPPCVLKISRQICYPLGCHDYLVNLVIPALYISH